MSQCVNKAIGSVRRAIRTAARTTGGFARHPTAQNAQAAIDAFRLAWGYLNNAYLAYGVLPHELKTEFSDLVTRIKTTLKSKGGGKLRIGMELEQAQRRFRDFSSGR